VPATRWICVLLIVTAISLLAGCDGSTYNVQNPPPPTQKQPSVAFTLTPPTGISLSPAALPTVQATVSNDPNNEGVDWELVGCSSDGSNCSASLCTITLSGAAPCGVLLNSSGQQVAHSASGDTLTYRLPSSFPIPGDAMMVEIIAFATANQASNVIAPITITAFGNVLQGTYVFQAQGNDPNGQPYQIAGVLTLDGNGNITSGQQTLNTVTGFSATVNSSQPNPNGGNYFAGSAYFVGTDGRGTITLNNMNDETGAAVEEIFSLVVFSSSQALISQLGDQPLPLTVPPSLEAYSASGTLQLQTSSTMPTNGYAFVSSGTDFSGTPIVFGGILNIDGQGSKNNPCTGPGCISGSGSWVDMDSANSTFLVSCYDATAPYGQVSQSTPGVVTLALNSAPNCFNSSAVQFTGYIVDSTHIQLIETDNTAGASGFLTAGLAESQGLATGTLTSFSGDYVWGMVGTDLSTITGPPFVTSSFTSAGAINADGAGDATGITDTLFLSWPSAPTNIPFGTLPFSATYNVAPSGVGRAIFKFNPAPKSGFDPAIVFYLTGSGTPPLMLYGAAGNKVYPAVGVGLTYAQQQPANSLAFDSGDAYGVAFSQTNGSENAGSGQMTATAPAGGSPGTLTGTVDDFLNNLLLAPTSPPLPLNDTFALPADNFGRIAGTFMAPLRTPPATNPAVEYYFIDPNHGLFVETDVVTEPSSQVTLGYFAQRCDVTSATSCQQAAAKRSHPRGSRKRGS